MSFRPLALAISCALAAPAAAGEIHGRVLVDDKPASGVAVAVRAFESGLAEARREARREEPSKPLAEVTTGRDGTFAASVPAAPGTLVQLSFSSGATTPVALESLLDAGGDDAGDVRLAKALPLAGRVVDERGGPVVGARVTLWTGSGRRLLEVARGVEPIPQSTTTKADGSFRFTAAGDAGNRLRVEAPAMATVERSQVRSGALRRSVILSLGHVLRGTVTAADKRTPAAGALVRFEGRTTTRWFEARRDGSFLVEGVPREAGSLVADAGDRGRATAAVAAGAGEPQLLVLAPTAAVAGRVVDVESGRPLTGVRLVARAAGSFLGRSGPDGRYVIRGLAPPRYNVTVDDERFCPWTRVVRVTAGETARQDVPLTRAATLVGRVVTEEGAPIEGATVQVIRGGENTLRAFVRSVEETGAVRSGKDGTFRATRLAPGDNERVDVRHDDYEERAIGGISLRPGATRSGITVVLGRGLSVRGVVKDDQDRPLAGAQVTLGRARSFRAGRGQMQLSLGAFRQIQRETGADGRFEFRGLKAGDYTVSARRAGFATASVDPVKVAEGRAGGPLELTLAPGTTISGFLHDGSGNGAAGWYVSARVAGESGGAPFSPGAIRTEEPTESDGTFVLEGLVSGETYDLQTMGPAGLGPRRAGVEAPADGIDLVVAGTGEIRGRVVDADSGRPVPDFEVRYQPDAQGGMRFVMRAGGRGRGAFEGRSFHTDDGAFVLENVPAGRWTVEASASGYQSGSASGVTVDEDESADGVEVRLSKGGVISGHVLESRTGRPILDATVEATLSSGEPRMRFGFGGGQQDNSASTDADGRYEIGGLAPGTWALTASQPDWSEATTTVELKDAPATADIRLGKGGSVGGVVLAAGRPVAGAQVSLSAAGDTGFRGMGMGGGDQGTLSDDGGRFRFERLTPGRYSVVATLRDESSNQAEAVLTGDESQEVQLVLAEGAAVHGVVSGLPDAQLANVTVSARGSDYVASTRTGAGGAFELTGVPEGAITLNARSGDLMAGSRTASTVVTIASGQTEATAEIVFEAGFHVDGHVSRSGQPVADAMVSAFPEGGRGLTSSARTDETGAFALDGLGEGSYTFMADVQGGSPVRKSVTLSGDTTVDLEVPPARIAGSVVEAESGRPLGDVSVRIEDDAPGMRFARAASSDSSGRFAFEDLEPRDYRVSFQKPAYQVETRQLTAAEDSDVRVELKRGEGLALLARDGIFATPLRGLFVRVADASGAAVFAGSVSLDSDGRGEVPSLQPGTYALRAESSGYAPVSLPAVAVPSQTLTLVLTPGGSLEIQVGPQTLALPQAQARLLEADGTTYMPSAFSTDGTIRLGAPVRRLDNVVPGSYVLEVDGGARRDVTVTEGGAAVVALP
jgi:Carboxypeptidase regulatory-like domain